MCVPFELGSVYAILAHVRRPSRVIAAVDDRRSSGAVGLDRGQRAVEPSTIEGENHLSVAARECRVRRRDKSGQTEHGETQRARNP
jgi:hypothetical protein